MGIKLNHQLAQTIRDRFAAGVPGKVLAFEYGVSKANISMIITNRIWTCKDSSLDDLRSLNELEQSLNRRKPEHAHSL